MKYVLKKSIQVGEMGPAVTEFIVREAVVAGDLRGIRMKDLVDPTMDDVLKLIGRLSGQPDVVVNRLSLEDFDFLGAEVMGFFKRGPETGSNGSPS